MEQIIEVRAIINFAKPYRIAEGGTTNEGITINYLMTDSFKPFDDETTGSQGYKSTKASLPLEIADKLVAVPGYYKLACTLGVNSQNQAQLKPFDVEFCQYCDIKFADLVEELEELEELEDSKDQVKEEPKLKEEPKDQVKEEPKLKEESKAKAEPKEAVKK